MFSATIAPALLISSWLWARSVFYCTRFTKGTVSFYTATGKDSRVCVCALPSVQTSSAQPGRWPGSWHTDPVAWLQPDQSPWEQTTWLRSPSYCQAAGWGGGCMFKFYKRLNEMFPLENQANNPLWNTKCTCLVTFLQRVNVELWNPTQVFNT